LGPIAIPIFVLAMAFSVGYLVYYHLGGRSEPHQSVQLGYVLSCIGSLLFVLMLVGSVPGYVRGYSIVGRLNRIETATRAGDIGNLESIILSQPNSNAQDRRIAVDAIAKMQNKDELIVPILAKALDDPDEQVQFSAVQTLSELGPRASLANAALINYLS